MTLIRGVVGVPKLQQAEQLNAFAEEVFSVSKDFWAFQSRGKGKQHSEITETEFLALDMLSKSQSTLNVGDIQKQIGVLPAQMSRIIRALETKGDQPLIHCEINPQDKRKIDVSLTDAGQKAHQAYREMKLSGIQNMLNDLSEEDRRELIRILRQIGENMRKSML